VSLPKAQVIQNFAYHSRIFNYREHSHRKTASDAHQGFHFVDLLNQLRPRAPAFPAEVIGGRGIQGMPGSDFWWRIADFPAAWRGGRRKRWRQ
jgi:hypothetical protein